MGRTWAAEAADFVAKLKTQRLGFQWLSSLDCHLDMVVGQDDLTRQQEPLALFELGVSPSSSASSSSANQRDREGEERFCVEFNHQELFDFFLQLERMQAQLDGLGKN